MTEAASKPALERRTYPVSLDVSGRPCLVVGAGRVAARKARALVDCGGAVTVVAPSFHPDMEALVPRLYAVERRPYRRGDAVGFRLVFTATGDLDVDGTVHREAEEAGVWVNAADDSAHSSFILPAVHRDGPVTVAVSTGGRSPALASWLRDRIAAHEADGVGTLAELLGQAREHLRAADVRPQTVDWGTLLDGPLLDLIRSGDLEGARAMVHAATRS
jgi:siroheme synthase-like protein